MLNRSKQFHSFSSNLFTLGCGKSNSTIARSSFCDATSKTFANSSRYQLQKPLDHRFEGSEHVGTALEHEEKILQQAFFPLEDETGQHRSRHLRH